jgi:hypothetical protein
MMRKTKKTTNGEIKQKLDEANFYVFSFSILKAMPPFEEILGMVFREVLFSKGCSY